MKHVRGLNKRSWQIDALTRTSQGDVVAQQGGVPAGLPVGCTALFQPGWEVNFDLYNTHSMCQPIETDTYTCFLNCSWAGTVPDGTTFNRGWMDDCAAVVQDWQRLRFAPKYGGSE